MSEFRPPVGYEGTFSTWRKVIGEAAYRSWMRDAEAWIALDSSIHIQPQSPTKAHWIRQKYAASLEKIAACSVHIAADSNGAVRLWPHNGPTAIDLENEEAWWQNNEWSVRECY